jgi:hypothetical protein
LALTLLTTPVSYRAGTETAHPHSFAQFLSDAADGTMDHHRRSGEHRQHVASEGTDETSVVSTGPPGVPTLDKLGPANERASALGLALLLALFVFASGRAMSFECGGRLVGLVVRPPAPPPRRILGSV